MKVRDDRKIVEIWLTNEEKQDQLLRERLTPFYQTYRARNYLVAVFQSGSEDLVQTTSGLLRYNKRRISELEVRRENNQTINMAI